MTDVINTGRLQSFMERLERLDDDKAAVAADMKEVFAEAKGEGEQTLVDLYLQSVEG
jgi:uncharacterized protein (UPF0335 family)